MPDKPAHRDMLAQIMQAGKETLIPHLAEMLKRDALVEVGSDGERRLFWQPALTDEQEARMWQQAMIQRGITELVPGSPAAIEIGLGISKAKYPGRWDMLEGEGRDHASDQAEWAMKHAREGPPKAEQQPAEAPTTGTETGEVTY